MKQLTTTLLLLLFTFYGRGANYYLSTLNGDDTRSAAQAQSSTTPWKTLAKINSVMSTLNAGDFINLRCGDVFPGSLTVNRNGTLAAPITFRSYGTGAKPIITGFATASGWTLVSGNIWQSSVISSAGAAVHMLVINNVPYDMGRTPNAGTTNGGYKTYEAHTSTSITDNDTTWGSGWANAEAVIRMNRYQIDHGVVSSISGNQITMTSASLSKFAASLSGVTDGFGYFLQNSIKTLDRFGEWYYDSSTHRVNMYFGPGGPTGYTVQVSVVDRLIQPEGNYQVYRDLNIQGANQYAIYNDWATAPVGDQFRNCTVLYSGIDHVYFANHVSTVIDSCVFNYANSNSIVFNYHNSDIIITNNLVMNSGTSQGMMVLDAANRIGNGIFSATLLPSAKGLTCINNTVLRTGHVGIYFDTNNNLVQNNFVDSAAMVIDDASAIYCYNYTTSGTRATLFNNYILDNVAIRSIGAKEGTNSNISFGHGIYLDDHVNHCVVRGNTTWQNSYSGIYIHNVDSSVIENNVCHGNKTFAMYYQDDQTAGDMISNTVRYNDLVADSSDQQLVYMGSVANNFAIFFKQLDSNRYCSPFNTNVVRTNYFLHTTTNYTLANWKSTFSSSSLDAHTTPMPKTIASKSAIVFNYNISALPLTLRFCGNTYTTTSGGQIRSKTSITPYHSTVLFK